MRGFAIGDAAASISDMIDGTSDSSKSVKCDPRWGLCASSSVGMELAVVSHNPGSWGSRGVGNIDIEDGTGICRDKDENGVKLTCAIRELAMLLYRVDMAFARLD